MVKKYNPMKRLILATISSVFAVGNGFAQTVSTPIVGFSNYNLSAGQYVLSPSFTKSAVHQASGTVSSQSLSVSGITTSSLAPTAFSDGRPNYPTSYIEVLSGPYAGVAFDVTGVTANSVTSSDFPSDLNGQSISFVIRNHVTLADIFKADSGFAEYSDGIAVYNSDGTVSLRFMAGGVITLDDFATDAGHTPIYPGTGVIVNVGSAVSIKTSGVVKATVTKVPVYPNINNIVGTMNPSSTLKVTDSTLATSLAPYADSATIYSNNGSFTLGAIVFSDGSSATDDNFNPFSSSSSPTVPNGSGAIINVSSPGYITLNSPVTP